ARAKSLRPMVDLKSLGQVILPALPRATWPGQKCARPDRGCPGGSIRSMQGGWGAQHRPDMQLSFFGLSGSRVLGSPDIGVAAPGKVQCFFENVDPMRPMTHFPAQLEAVSRPKNGVRTIP